MFEQIGRDQLVVQFAGAQAGTEPLTWGQKAILQDMRDNVSQFNMGGMTNLPVGSGIGHAASRLSDLMRRHAALRVRLGTDVTGRQCQQVAGSGQIGLDILTVPDDADRAEVARFVDDLMETWPLTPFDFTRDWPLRMAAVRHRGACLHLVWVLAHLVADGAAHLLLLGDLMPGGMESRPAAESGRQQILDVASSEQTPRLRQLSGRTMRHWEAQLSHIPVLTFGEPVQPPGPLGQAGRRYWRVRFTSPAAHLAMLAIARRTGTDASRVTLGVLATAIGRATRIPRLTINVMVNNRFRAGLSDVIAPIAQNSVITIDVADASVDEVVARARGASLASGMRAYYDPDDLAEVAARLDAGRGYPARVSCRVNDQRAMVRRADDAGLGDVTPGQVRLRLPESSLTWLSPMDNLHDQAVILVENRPDVVSLYLMCDLWSLSRAQVEALLRGVEEVAVEAAFDPSAPTKVAARAVQPG